MATFSLRRAAFILVPALAFCAVGAVGGPAAHAGILPIPDNCQQVQQLDPLAQSGNYTLEADGNIFTVYCDMSGTPTSYINLAKTGANFNYSQYTAGGAAPGTNVRTTFTKLRIDPATLTVDIGDLTFATSTGYLLHPVKTSSVPVTSMAYASAEACNKTGDNGTGNIDLEGTPFQVASTFTPGGYEASGSATVSPDNQVVNVEADGDCGYITPASTVYEPRNPDPGQYVLKLSCSQTTPVIGVLQQTCLHLG
jgi:GON domain